MRQQITSLHYWLGCPVLFLTLNPADVAHPLILRYSFNGSSLNDMPLDLADTDLQRVLAEHDLATLVAWLKIQCRQRKVSIITSGLCAMICFAVHLLPRRFTWMA